MRFRAHASGEVRGEKFIEIALEQHPTLLMFLGVAAL
jgi:hypothetical protein